MKRSACPCEPHPRGGGADPKDARCLDRSQALTQELYDLPLGCRKLGDGVGHLGCEPGGINHLLQTRVVVGVEQALPGQAHYRSSFAPLPATPSGMNVRRDSEQPGDGLAAPGLVPGGRLDDRHERRRDEVRRFLGCPAPVGGEGDDLVNMPPVELLECTRIRTNLRKQRPIRVRPHHLVLGLLAGHRNIITGTSERGERVPSRPTRRRCVR